MKNSIPKKQLREFGLLIGFGFPIIIGWILPSVWGHGFRFWTFWVGMTSLVLTMVNPQLLFYPYNGWMILGNILGWINSRIIFGLVFIVVLQPIALIMRIFGYDPLRKKKSKTKTYRENKSNHKIDLTRIF